MKKCTSVAARLLKTAKFSLAYEPESQAARLKAADASPFQSYHSLLLKTWRERV